MAGWQILTLLIVVRIHISQFFRNVAQWLEHWSYKPEAVGSSPTVPILPNAYLPNAYLKAWDRSQTGKAPVLQTGNCGFEPHRFHSDFLGVGQWLPTCLGSKPTQVRVLPPRLYVRVAQWKFRALVYETRGRRFESFHEHQIWLVSTTGSALG